MRRVALLVVLTLLCPVYLASAQESDCAEVFSQVNTLLDQTVAPLESGDVTTAQALISAANALLAPCLESASCPSAPQISSLLEQAAVTTEASSITALLTGTQSLLTACIPAETSPDATVTDPCKTAPLDVLTSYQWGIESSTGKMVIDVDCDGKFLLIGPNVLEYSDYTVDGNNLRLKIGDRTYELTPSGVGVVELRNGQDAPLSLVPFETPECGENPLDIILNTRWQMVVDDTITYDFRCNNVVIISAQDETIAVFYEFDGSNITVKGRGGDIVFADVLALDGIFSATINGAATSFIEIEPEEPAAGAALNTTTTTSSNAICANGGSAELTLTIDEVFVRDPEEADTIVNIIGGDEVYFIYGIAVIDSAGNYDFGTNDSFAEQGSVDAFAQSRFTNFNAVSRSVTCGEQVSVIIYLYESDAPFGIDYDLGFEEIEFELTASEIPSLEPQTELVFSGTSHDSSFVYELTYTLEID